MTRKMKIADLRVDGAKCGIDYDPSSPGKEAAVSRFAELARVERLALEEGVGMQSDWLRAEAGLFQARAGLAEARHRVLSARIAWARATGRLDLRGITELLEVAP